MSRVSGGGSCSAGRTSARRSCARSTSSGSAASSHSPICTTRAPRETRSSTRDPIEYWEDYPSAQDVLDRLDPATVVFRGLSSPRPIALNVIAKSRGIPTYILNHGTVFSADDARRETMALGRHRSANRAEAGSFVQEVSGSTRHGIDVLRASLRGRHLTALRRSSRTPSSRAMAPRRQRSRPLGPFPRDFRAPISATRSTTPESRASCAARTAPQALLGNPEYDEYFRTDADAAGQGSSGDGDYYLFVDSIMAAPDLLIAFMTLPEAISVYERVARFAARKGEKLVVKLHPSLPESPWLPRHLESVEWVRQADLTALVTGAIACFGYFSTLLLSAAWKKRVCFLEHFRLSILEEARATGMVHVEDARTFDPHSFELGPTGPVDRSAFEELFFWRADGRATERLGAVLRHGLHARSTGLELLAARQRATLSARR